MSGVDLHVAGAGPAGLAAAITAARGGARVVVHEKADRVGSRFHHDFQGLESWTVREDVLAELGGLGIDLAAVTWPCRAQQVFAPDGSEHEFRAREPFYYLVRRGWEEGTLDRALLAQAQAAGVEVRFADPVHDLPAGSIVTHGPRRADVIATGYVFATDMADGAWVALGSAVAPGGYAYLLVQGGRGTLSVCLFDQFRRARALLAAARDHFVRRAGLRWHHARLFGGVGNVDLPVSALRDGRLLAGEAAAFQDPLWGFGIRSALLSGHLAAQAVLAGDAAGYDRAWRRRLGWVIQSAAVNRFFYARLGSGGYRWLIERIARSPDSRDTLRALYRITWWKRLLFPLVRRSVLAGAVRRRAAAAALAPAASW